MTTFEQEDRTRDEREGEEGEEGEEEDDDEETFLYYASTRAWYISYQSNMQAGEPHGGYDQAP